MSNKYSEILAKCTISNDTKGFLSCILSLSDLYNQVYDSIKEMYGEIQVEEIIEKEYRPIENELRDLLFSFVQQSIDEHISCVEFDKI